MVESEVTPLIEDVEKAFADIYLKPLVSEFTPAYGLPVESLTFPENEEACSHLIEAAVRLLENAVGFRRRRIIIADAQQNE
jgi:hypothetical protein